MIDVKNRNLTGLKFIDLFTGLGEFRLTLESFGAEYIYSNEWDKYAQEVYKMNFGEMPEHDITFIDGNSVLFPLVYTINLIKATTSVPIMMSATWRSGRKFIVLISNILWKNLSIMSPPI